MSIAGLHKSRGERQRALEHAELALALARKLNDRKVEADALYFIGAMHEVPGEQEKAAGFYDRALALSRQLKEPGLEARSLASLARFARDGGNFALSLSLIRQAIALVEKMRVQLPAPELRASYFSANRHYYEFYIDLLMRLDRRHPSAGHAAEALQASESARARSLMETLMEAGAGLRQGVDPSLLERERVLLRKLRDKALEIDRLGGGKSEQAQAALKHLNQEVTLLATELEIVQAQLRQAIPLGQPLTLAQIQQQALDAGTVLLEYALGAEQSYLWLVTKDSLRSYALPPRAQVEEAAQRFLDWAFNRLPRERFETDEEYRERRNRAGTQLSRMILDPIADQIGGKRLLIASDGKLQFVPFAALPKPDGGSKTAGGNPRMQRLPGEYRPLILDHEIVNLPSASTLAVLRQKLRGRAPAPKMLAALADPVFSSSDERARVSRAQSKSAQPHLSGNRDVWLEALVPALRSAGPCQGADCENALLRRLPYTAREARAILALVPAAERREALGFDANRELVMSGELGRYRYVHFATHGFINDDHPNLSGIVLSLIDSRGAQADGFLRLVDVFNLDLRAELVVLSACRTGVGREVSGEGLIGLTRGFMYAGAARVVASLWSVDDAATAGLMERFYQEMLVRKLPPAAALRAAQVAFLREPRWRRKGMDAPYFWAAFTLQGEPR